MSNLFPISSWFLPRHYPKMSRGSWMLPILLNSKLMMMTVPNEILALYRKFESATARSYGNKINCFFKWLGWVRKCLLFYGLSNTRICRTAFLAWYWWIPNVSLFHYQINLVYYVLCIYQIINVHKNMSNITNSWILHLDKARPW